MSDARESGKTALREISCDLKIVTAMAAISAISVQAVHCQLFCTQIADLPVD